MRPAKALVGCDLVIKLNNNNEGNKMNESKDKTEKLILQLSIHAEGKLSISDCISPF